MDPQNQAVNQLVRQRAVTALPRPQLAEQPHDALVNGMTASCAACLDCLSRAAQGAGQCLSTSECVACLGMR